jgi:chromate transporter
MSPREFGEAWALSQLSPGIHLVALAGLVGRRAAGWRGTIAAVAGMMIPAAAITVALTAGYAVIAASPLARAALAGIAPITGGMTIATAALLARTSARHGRAHLLTDVAVCLASLVAAVFGVPTLAAVGAGAAVGALALGPLTAVALRVLSGRDRSLRRPRRCSTHSPRHPQRVRSLNFLADR